MPSKRASNSPAKALRRGEKRKLVIGFICPNSAPPRLCASDKALKEEQFSFKLKSLLPFKYCFYLIALRRINILIMPPQVLPRRSLLFPTRQYDQLPSMHGIILPPVPIVLFNPTADFHMIIFGDGKIATVEEGV